MALLGILAAAIVVLVAALYLKNSAGPGGSEPAILPSGNNGNTGAASAEKAPNADPRIDQIRGLLRTDPENALALCREVLVGDATSDAKQKALEQLSNCTLAVFDRRQADGRLAECDTLAAEISLLFPDSRAAEQLSQKWAGARRTLIEQKLAADDLAGAIPLLKAALADPAEKNAQSLWNAYTTTIGRTWPLLVQSGDTGTADARFAEAFGLAGEMDARSLRDAFLDCKVAAYRATRKAGRRDLARGQLLAAAETQGLNIRSVQEARHNLSSAYQQACREEWDSDGLLAEGDRFRRANSPIAALAFYAMAEIAATQRITYHPQTGIPTTTYVSDAASRQNRDRARERLNTCALGAARHLASGKSGAPGQEAARNLYSGLLQECANTRRRQDDKNPPSSKELRTRCDIARELMNLELALARAYVHQNKIASAETLLRHVQRGTAVELWEAENELARINPWSQVPRNVMEELNRRQPGGTEDQRLAALRALALTGSFVVPQARAAAAVLEEIAQRKLTDRVERAVSSLGYSRHSAFSELRSILRTAPGTAAARRAAEGVRAAILNARQSMDLSALNELCGFYVAEVGPPATTDPFREELRSALTDTAEKYRESSPMMRVFILSLLADALPGEAASDRARQEAMEKGLQLMRTLPSRNPDKAGDIRPSGLDGLSVLCIANTTPNHMLIFLDGPEQCFVRLNPYRQGSLVLRNGKYVTAVVVTADDVAPYRSEQTYETIMSFHAYRIIEEGPQSWRSALQPPATSASGDFTLLRVPPDTGPFQIDGRTGRVTLASATERTISPRTSSAAPISNLAPNTR